MNDIICPHCGKAFKIDDSGYADILKQVRDREFEQQLQERLTLAENEKRSAISLAVEKVKAEMQTVAAGKELEIQELKSSLEPGRSASSWRSRKRSVRQKSNAIFWLVNSQQVRDSNTTATRLAETKFAKEIQAITLKKDGELRELRSQLESSGVQQKLRNPGGPDLC